MNRFLKPLRVAVSLIFLVSITFIFIDFRQLLPSSWYDVITYFQFVPSIFKFIGFAGLLSVGFLVIILLTVFYGRVYCSAICPFGIIQDVISYISRYLNLKKSHFLYLKQQNSLRYGFLGLAVLLLCAGGAQSFHLLDPYSNYGRISSDLFRPLYIAGNNLLVEVLIRSRIYALTPINVVHFSILKALFPLMLFTLITWMSLFKGRLYCNTICPVGTLFGLISRYSIFRITIDKSHCNQCGTCARSCKSGCIDIKNQAIDNSRCVGCFNCLKSCTKDGVKYSLSYSASQKTIPDNTTDASKRRFIANSLIVTVSIIGFPKLASVTTQVVRNGSALVPVKKIRCSSPPGSKSTEHFNRNCTGCHLCVSACPSKVIQPSLFEYGLAGFLQPYMDYQSGLCDYECTRCGEICPTGAIEPLKVEEKKLVQIGIVKFITNNCLVYTNKSTCGTCAAHCPTQAIKMVPYQGKLALPEVNADVCNGCGACEHVCPTIPFKAIYVEGIAVHRNAQKPQIKKLEITQPENFPF